MLLSKLIQNTENDFDSICNIFPTMSNLQNVLENNICHCNESVYDHTKQVYLNLVNLEKELGFISRGIKIDLLKLAIIFHDSGKEKVIKIDTYGQTTCLEHEQEGGIIFKSNLKVINDLNWIYNFIINHEKIHIACDLGREDFSEKFQSIVINFNDMYKEILIFGYCDLLNSHLKISNLTEYDRRIKILRECIEKLY